MPSRPDAKYINVYLALGSNVGDRAKYLTESQSLIQRYIGKIVRRSHIYETEPWGNPKQAPFLNCVVMVNTTLSPREVLDAIGKIERQLGRQRQEKWGPRTIDIDILFYGRRVIRDKGLEIPHPELHKRAFVLVPMLELAPDLEHPVLKKPIDELYMECTDMSEVIMLEDEPPEAEFHERHG
ncbi:MAG: 2-amino-4-hydroxy-6-hydroxymethyldihydropteridine diphosphokinase [Saprospiraceae bacterium]|nr:2-amino-4-hydroxy-6-hydroxymethyldihydropteridine diphosphokinase [Saprospiraceae bacterium]MDW8483037.1 2-amino-4-hydroxy-6-hydroxymethyldihydropteridine diphosphokinase [Saprospiraceae bacterium]